MMRMMALSSAVLACIGCTEREPPQPTAAAVEEAVTEAARSASAQAAGPDEQAPDPCALLTEAMVREHFGVETDVDIAQKPSKHSHHPLCTYSWNTLSEEEQKAEQAEMIRRLMARMKEGKTGGGLLDVAHMGSEIAHLTVVRDAFDSPAAAQSGLESIRERMQEGIKSKVRAEEVKFKSRYEPVEGVGDLAYWSPTQSQLSFARATQIFHLGVKARDPSKNIELATALARAVMEQHSKAAGAGR
jgi:hypothetical protein